MINNMKTGILKFSFLGLGSLFIFIVYASSSATELKTDFKEAYDVGTIEAFEKFCSDHYAPERLVYETSEFNGCAVKWLEFRRRFGQSDFEITENRSFGEMHWYKSRALNLWFGIAFGLNEDRKVIWRAIDSGVIPTFADKPEIISAKNRSLWVADYLQELEAEGIFSGIVAIKIEDEIQIFPVGLANQDTSTAVLENTKFQIASVGKMFTAAAILKLIDNGELSLDDFIIQHLPDYPIEVAEEVTLRHLLNHTSGIEMDDNPDFNRKLVETKSVGEIMNLHKEYIYFLNDNRFQDFSPLEEYDYSNEDYDILGGVLATKTKTSWKRSLNNLIFEQAGMANTSFNRNEANAAVGYTMRKEVDSPRLVQRIQPNLHLIRENARPAGSHFTTAMDLILFLDFVQGFSQDPNSVFNDATQIQAGYSKDPSMEIEQGYGFGFQIEKTRCGSSFGHNGGEPGVSAAVKHYIDQNASIVVLSNRETVALDVARYLEWRLLSC